jgi:wyosine [tRNA(Phe)-imidazoG37] synthetase (radical SAM superfamily)
MDSESNDTRRPTSNPEPGTVYVFGPVPSRRLGLSLGVDLIPHKTCTFECLYCQIGPTSCKTLDVQPYVPVQDVVGQIETKLEEHAPDSITLAGSGEPTLHSEIDRVIDLIRDVADIKISLLTNGSLFWREEVRRRVMEADIVMPTLCSAFESTFRKIHRPHPDLRLPLIVEGLGKFRQEYQGLLFLEVMLLAGINDTEEELEALKKAIGLISPDKVQLNTVIRPPANADAKAIDRERLRKVRDFFGGNAEIIADVPTGRKGHAGERLANSLLDMLQRRPMTTADVSKALSLSAEQAENLIKGLLMKGHIRRQRHSGNNYYSRDGKDV